MPETVPVWTNGNQTQTTAAAIQETLEERLKRIEAENKSIVDSFNAERQKSAGLEAKVHEMERAFEEASRIPEGGAPPPQTVGLEDKVTLLARDPDGYIRRHARAEAESLKNEILGQISFDRKLERAERWLSKKLGVDESEIASRAEFKEIKKIIADRKLTYVDPEVGIQTAYELYLLEKKVKEEAEMGRSSAISSQATEPPGMAPKPAGPGRFTRKQLASMPLDEFNRRYDEIKAAEAQGLIVDDTTPSRV